MSDPISAWVKMQAAMCGYGAELIAIGGRMQERVIRGMPFSPELVAEAHRVMDKLRTRMVELDKEMVAARDAKPKDGEPS